MIAEAASGIVSFLTNVEKPTKVVCEFSPVQAGSGDPAPDNIRLLSAWTKANIYNKGVNLFNKDDLESDTNRYLSDNGTFRTPQTGSWRVSNYIPVKGGNVYTISRMQSSATSAVSLCWYDRAKQYLSSVKYLSSLVSKSATAPDNACYVRLSVKYSLLGDCQFELGEEATEYKSYEGRSLSISWGDDEGTVYGGSLILNEGGSADLVVKTVAVTVGSLTWTDTDVENFFRCSAPNKATSDNANIICDTYKTVAASISAADAPDLSIKGGTVNTGQYRNYVYIKDSNYSTASDFKAGRSDVMFTYNLYTPEDPIHFSNIGSLNSFLGKNSVLHDMNGGITVEYYKHH